MTECTCKPGWAFHQYHCEKSRKLRKEKTEAGKPPTPIDVTKYARVRADD